MVIAWNRPGSSARRVAGRERLEAAGVAVLFEDAHLLAVDKPAGLLTDAASQEQVRDEDTLTKRARAWVGRPEVTPVHRIDRDTTGVVLFAKTSAAREALKLQWAARSPLRRYRVVVEGVVRRDEGHFADWMRWDGAARVQRPCRPGDEGGVLAEADWRVVERLAGGATVLQVRLDSGRRNQIRLHAELWGHPLVGERQYRRAPTQIPFGRQALHAERLRVEHPATGEPIAFEAPLPADLERLIARLKTPTSTRSAPRRGGRS